MEKLRRVLRSKSGIAGFLLALIAPIHKLIQWMGDLDFIASYGGQFLKFLDSGAGFAVTFLGGCVVIAYGLYTTPSPVKGKAQEVEGPSAPQKPYYTPMQREDRYKAWKDIETVIDHVWQPTYQYTKAVGANWVNQIVNSGSEQYRAKLLDATAQMREAINAMEGVLQKHQRFPDIADWVRESQRELRTQLNERADLLKDKLKALVLPAIVGPISATLVRVFDLHAEEYLKAVRLFGEWIDEAKRRITVKTAELEAN
jgi:hypothetical protein